MNNIQEAILNAKERFLKPCSFDHKYALEALIYVLEDYLNLSDSNFQKILINQKLYNKLKEYKLNGLNYDFKVFMNNHDKYINNSLIPYARNSNNTNLYVYNEYVDPNICLRVVADFLYTIDIELYNLFCELYQKGHILFKDNYVGGKELSEKKKDSIYIIMGPLISVSDMGTLVHEMGHAYKDYLFEDYHRYYNVDELLHSEISSEVLELMFYNYLVNNNIFYYQAINCLNAYNNSMINDSRYLLKNNYNKTYLSTLSYLIGKIIGKYYTMNVNCSYHDLMQYIYLHDIKKVFKDLNINHEEIIKGINKEFCLIR